MSPISVKESLEVGPISKTNKQTKNKQTNKQTKTKTQTKNKKQKTKQTNKQKTKSKINRFWGWNPLERHTSLQAKSEYLSQVLSV